MFVSGGFDRKWQSRIPDRPYGRYTSDTDFTTFALSVQIPLSVSMLYADKENRFNRLYFTSMNSLWQTGTTHTNNLSNWHTSRSQWPRGLWRRSTAAHLLRSWVRIPPRAWMFVCSECCVLSGRGLCDGLIIRSEESYRLWRVIVCDQETS